MIFNKISQITGNFKIFTKFHNIPQLNGFCYFPHYLAQYGTTKVIVEVTRVTPVVTRVTSIFDQFTIIGDNSNRTAQFKIKRKQ